MTHVLTSYSRNEDEIDTMNYTMARENRYCNLCGCQLAYNSTRDQRIRVHSQAIRGETWDRLMIHYSGTADRHARNRPHVTEITQQAVAPRSKAQCYMHVVSDN